MKIRVLKAPGGPGMEAERISALLRKRVTKVGSSDQPHSVLEIKGGTPEDTQTLLDNKYELLVRKKKTVWVNPRFYN